MRTREMAAGTARQIMKEKFPQAQLAFCAGSIVRGEGTETSDIDLVVVFPKLDHAYREAFIFNGWPVEALIHDLETLRYFFYEVDRPSGCMALPQMVLEGVVVWGDEKLGESLKEEALEIQKMGPPPLSQEDIKNRIYGITDLIDDLKAPKSREEAIGIAIRLYDQLSDFALRSQGSWSGDGKQIPRCLKKVSPRLYERFTAAFENFFSRNETQELFVLARDLIKDFGGFNFDGYYRAAPSEWRIKSTDQKASHKSIVLALFYPGCIFFEIALALDLLSEKYEIQFATPDGKDHRASNGSLISSCISYGNIDLNNVTAILVPGGDPGSIKDNLEIEEILRKANEKEILLAAICAGPFVLAKAGILKGRKIAHGYEPEQIEFLKDYFMDVELTDEKLVSDGHFITARPEAHIDFAVDIAVKINSVAPDRARELKDYYKGLCQ